MLGTIGRIWIWRLGLYTVADEHELDLFFIVNTYNNYNKMSGFVFIRGPSSLL